MTSKLGVSGTLLGAVILGACLVPQDAAAQGCAKSPRSSLVVNVKSKGAKGDGRTDDTRAIQRAIDEVAGTGGTVLVPDGVYMVDGTAKPRLELKSDLTLKLSARATLKQIPTNSERYNVLAVTGTSNITIVGGTLEGERYEHKGKAGAGGMGVRIRRGASNITVSGVTAKKMWGDGFLVEGAKDVTFCGVTADDNRRQGLSIIDVKGMLVTNSVFKNTHGTKPADGIDIEPDDADQTVTDLRIERSKFLDNQGWGIELAGKRGHILKVEIMDNVFEGNRPILNENSPAVRSSMICRNRFVGEQDVQPSGLNAFAEPAEFVALQQNCAEGRDSRFEINRITKKKKTPN